MSTAGDFNGDGYDDILVGASYAGAGETFDAGETYVVFGSGNGSAASLDLSTLDGSNGFRLDGIDAGDWSGHSVSTAGDVNGDGYADILVGGYGADGFTGETYVVFGSGSEFAASLDLSTLDGSNGFRLDGIAAGDRSGISVSTAGDLNGDGYDDILVGAPYADAGATYVVFGSGSEFASSVDLSTLDGDNGFRLDGIVAMPTLGNSVSTAGDFNGDSYTDILVGAFRAGTYSGAMYVIFGSGSGFASSVSVDTLDGSNGLRLNVINTWHNSGEEVSTAGDVNGDGYDDILVGARRANNSTGQTYVVFGSGSGFAASLDLSTLDGSNGFRLDGIDVEDYSGISVSTAGDVNGDGYDDMLVGAYRADRGGAGDAGETYVIFGTDSGFAASLNLSTLDGSNGIRLDGTPLNEKSGSAVSTAGDINGDGYADILIGAPKANSRAGKTYVVFGGDFTESVTHAGTSADDTLTGDATANVIVAGQGDDVLDGNGGADVLYAAEGNDVLKISDTTFARVDGGSGNDKLVLDGSGITLDLTRIADNKVTGIETIDLTGTGNNTLVVSSLEVLNLSDTSNSLTVKGEAEDIVLIGPQWTFGPRTQVAGNNQPTRFTDGAAELLVYGPRIGLYLPEGSGPWTISLDGTDLLFTDGTLTTRLPKKLTEEILIRGSDSADSVSIGPLGSGVWPFFNGSVTLNLGDGDDLVDASATDVAVKLNGSAGNDTLKGGISNDTLIGGSGEDSLTGGPGNDRFLGQFGFDHIFESADVDFTVTDNSLTGRGNDTFVDVELIKLFGGSTGNTLDASLFTGRTLLNGRGGDDVITGGLGQDRIFGGSGRDILEGGNADDVLSGQQGDDILDGGDGDDRVSESADVDFVLTDNVLVGVGRDTLASVELARLFGGSSANRITAVAFGGRAYLNGNGGNDVLFGGINNDTLLGGGGEDLIFGRGGKDRLFGQDGDDTLHGQNAADRLNGGPGEDELFGGNGRDRLVAVGKDTLFGGDAQDTLFGSSGSELHGGNGDDVLNGRHSNRLNGGAGQDTLYGSYGHNTLLGGAGDDVIAGGSGEDLLRGQGGNDTLRGYSGNDTLIGGIGDDWLDGMSDNDAVSGSTGNDVLFGRSGDDTLVGGDGHDSLYGESGHDILQGDDGKPDTDHASDNDLLDGGTGGDTVRGGGGSDTMLDDESEVDENFAYWAEWVDAV